MHQRRKPTAKYTATSQLTVARNKKGSRQGIDALSTLLWLFLALLICAELFAYKSFDIADDAPTTASSSSAISSGSDSIGRNALVADGNKNIIEPSYHHNHNQHKQARDTSKTFKPTTSYKGRRIKHARYNSHKNSFYWKTHIPDPVPPLPPDTDNNGKLLPPIVAYVITLTKCNPQKAGSLDGAAVLLHSIRRNSYGWTSMEEQISSSTMEHDVNRWPSYGGHGGKYRYRAYVIVDPEASPNDPTNHGDCARYLQKLGYVVLHRAPLVPLFPITNEYYDMDKGESNDFFEAYKNSGYVGSQRSTTGPLARPDSEREETLLIKMHDDGCCGYAETLKLHVYGLVQHPIAVHLDMDSLLLRPMDDLFDSMLGVKSGDVLPLADGPKTKTPDYNKPIDAAFTRDYNSVKFPSKTAQVGYQGGFLAIRPSLEVLERYREILKRGEFMLGGLVPYYYEEVAPQDEHNTIELDRCRYNQMADNPYKSSHRFPRATPLVGEVMGYHDTNTCRDGSNNCSKTDCQRVHPKESVTAHFTFCNKPWDCSEGLPGTVADATCKGLLREWFAIRAELEDWWLLLGESDRKEELAYRNHQSTMEVKIQRVQNSMDHFLGYCKSRPMQLPQYQKMIEPDDSEIDISK